MVPKPLKVQRDSGSWADAVIETAAMVAQAFNFIDIEIPHQVLRSMLDSCHSLQCGSVTLAEILRKDGGCKML
jgi:hypothetical protein